MPTKVVKISFIHAILHLASNIQQHIRVVILVIDLNN
jgi:hypothetical protein